MKTMFLAALLAMTTFALPAAERDTRCFELRTYYAAPGKLDALNARFREHTCKLFEKHGMANIGYWMPIDNTNNALIYLLAYPSREAARRLLTRPVMRKPSTSLQSSYERSNLSAQPARNDGRLDASAALHRQNSPAYCRPITP